MKSFVQWTLLCSAALIAGAVTAQTEQDEQAIYSALEAQKNRACPVVWEGLAASMNTETLTAAPWEGNVSDRAEFLALMTEIMTGSPAAEIETMTDDLATVATECASHRVALLDALISKTPRDVLLAMDAVNKGLNKTIEHLNGGWTVGDVRITGRPDPQDGWLFLRGQTVGSANSTATLKGDDYNELFELAKQWHPNTGTEDWSAGHKVKLPDTRGRALVGNDIVDGISANRITSTNADKVAGPFGIQSRAITANQLPTHKHTMSSNGSHSHTVGTDSHTHKLRSSAYGGSSAPQSTYPYFEGRARTNYQNTIQSSVLSDSHNHSLSSASKHSHTINNTGSSAVVLMTQPSIVFNVEMKY